MGPGKTFFQMIEWHLIALSFSCAYVQRDCDELWCSRSRRQTGISGEGFPLNLLFIPEIALQLSKKQRNSMFSRDTIICFSGPKRSLTSDSVYNRFFSLLSDTATPPNPRAQHSTNTFKANIGIRRTIFTEAGSIAYSATYNIFISPRSLL